MFSDTHNNTQRIGHVHLTHPSRFCVSWWGRSVETQAVTSPSGAFGQCFPQPSKLVMFECPEAFTTMKNDLEHRPNLLFVQWEQPREELDQRRRGQFGSKHPKGFWKQLQRFTLDGSDEPRQPLQRNLL